MSAVTSIDEARRRREAVLREAGIEQWETDLADRLDWKILQNGSTKLEKGIHNVATMLREHPSLSGRFRLNRFSGLVEYCGRPIVDVDYTRMASWFDHDAGRFVIHGLKDDDVRRAVYLVASEHAYNPLTDYLSALQWDGTGRLDAWLSRYVGAEDAPYTRLVGRLWLVSAVARAFAPGCKADHVLIFEGDQGRGKSSAFAALVPDARYFSDSPVDIGTKDGFLLLRGKLIVELAEIASLNKAETDRAKAFFSASTDDFRKPYGREVESVGRSCVFGGTVNGDRYLRDPTGNRRYWCVRTGAFRLDDLRRDRDQLWAEAVRLYQEGEAWWPETDEHRALIHAATSEREIEDPWTPRIAAYLTGRGDTTIHEVMVTALDLSASHARGGDGIRVATCLRALGWASTGTRRKGSRDRVWCPIDPLAWKGMGQSVGSPDPEKQGLF